MSAVALRITDYDVRTRIVPALKRHRGGNLKEIARAGDVGPDTAKNWIEGRNCPALATAINLAREIPELRAELFRLMSPEAEFEAEFMQDFMRLAQTYQRIVAAKGRS